MRALSKTREKLVVEFSRSEWRKISDAVSYVANEYDAFDPQRLDFTEEEIFKISDEIAEVMALDATG